MNTTGIRVEAVAEAGADMTELLTETAEGDRRQPASSAPPASPGGMAARKRLRVTGIGFDLGKTIMGCRRPRFVAPPTSVSPKREASRHRLRGCARPLRDDSWRGCCGAPWPPPCWRS